jgi:hypothetical protein
MSDYSAIFESNDIVKEKRKYPEGLNTLVQLAIGSKEVFKHPKRLRSATTNKKRFAEGVYRMRELTEFLHDARDDHQTGQLMEITRDTYLAVLQPTKDVHQIKAAAEIATGIEVRDGEDAISIFSRGDTIVESRESLLQGLKISSED